MSEYPRGAIPESDGPAVYPQGDLDIEELFLTGREVGPAEIDAIKSSLGIGTRRVHYGDRPDVSGLAQEMGLDEPGGSPGY